MHSQFSLAYRLRRTRCVGCGNAYRSWKNYFPAPHRIRELQVTREPVELFANNPINILIAEFEAAHDKQSGVGRE